MNASVVSVMDVIVAKVLLTARDARPVTPSIEQNPVDQWKGGRGHTNEGQMHRSEHVGQVPMMRKEREHCEQCQELTCFELVAFDEDEPRLNRLNPSSNPIID